MHAVLARHGDGRKQLWITEVGWPTHRGYGVSEEKQAQYVARMQAATCAQRLPVLTWYTYGDYDDPSDANQEAHFGFFRADGTPKPSYFALGAFARVFAGTHFVADRSRALGLPPGAENTGGRGFALEYARSGARVTALWYANESGAEGQGAGPSGGPAGPRSGAVPERHGVRVEAEVLGAPERRRKGAVTGAVVARIGDSRAVALGREGVGAGP